MTADEPNVCPKRFNSQFVLCQDVELPSIGLCKEGRDLQFPHDVGLVEFRGSLHLDQDETSIVHSHEEIRDQVRPQLRRVFDGRVATFVRCSGDESKLCMIRRVFIPDLQWLLTKSIDTRAGHENAGGSGFQLSLTSNAPALSIRRHQHE